MEYCYGILRWNGAIEHCDGVVGISLGIARSAAPRMLKTLPTKARQSARPAPSRFMSVNGSRLPGIDDRDSEAYVIVDIACDNGKIVFERGGRDQTIRRIERAAS